MVNQTRIVKVQERMCQINIDSIIIPLGINFRWLFGILEDPSERLIIAYVHSETEPVLIAPSFEVARFKRLTNIKNCIGWEETDNPYSMLKTLIPNQNGVNIALEPKMWYSIFNTIAKELPSCNYTDAGNIFNHLRAIKDENEQKLLLKASKKSGDVIIQTLQELEIGISEMEVQNILKERLIWESAGKASSLVQFGNNSSFPHYHGGEKRLEKDSVVLIDAGGTLNDYWGDITITTFFGSAPRKFKRIYDIVYNANKIGKEAVIKNTIPSEIDRQVRGYITQANFGKYFTHRTGHGIGLEIHEHPYIFGNNSEALVEGNAFTIEPGVYIPGEFGIRIEDNLIKTKNGYNSTEIPRYEILEI
ncbi:M24 family metallopeptidase [Candidatus Hodarchaeum mangrovi]